MTSRLCDSWDKTFLGEETVYSVFMDGPLSTPLKILANSLTLSLNFYILAGSLAGRFYVGG